MLYRDLFQAVIGAHPVIARADVSLSAKDIVGLAVQAGRVLFDAEVVFHERIAPMSGSLVPLDQYVYTLNNTRVSSGVSITSLDMNSSSNPVIEDAEIIGESTPSVSQETSLAAPNVLYLIG